MGNASPSMPTRFVGETGSGFIAMYSKADKTSFRVNEFNVKDTPVPPSSDRLHTDLVLTAWHLRRLLPL